MKISLKRPDWRKCGQKFTEFAVQIGKAAGVVILLSFFFYRSLWAAIPLAAVGILFFRAGLERKKEKWREELNGQFKECILSVATSLKSGYAAENAFVESRNDMRLLYGENSAIYQELERIRRGLVINITLEELLTDLAQRSGSEEVMQFAQIFVIAKRSGGNLPEIISTSAELIGQRIDAKEEINTLLSGRQMEQNIMKLVPFGILLYIGVSSPGYFDPLYHNLKGVAIMTGCLAVYLVAYVLGDKILQKIAREMG